MSTYQAKIQFEENLKLFGNATSQPEKYNLYAGLINLTKAIEQIKSDLRSIKDDIFIIKNKS
ncbi:hypothetical protein KKB06_00770 [Patescibacteria group bacterium]|nr:hypothetical protein [Patescibacteria group bacterium]